MCQKRRERHKIVKQELLSKHGSKCMLCGEVVPQSEVTLHHIRPRYLDGADDYENCALLCKYCHFDVVNKINHESEEYIALMNQVKSNKKRTKRYE